MNYVYEFMKCSLKTNNDKQILDISRQQLKETVINVNAKSTESSIGQRHFNFQDNI